MIYSNTCVAMLNKQMAQEDAARLLYQSMAAFFSSQNLGGLERYFLKEADGEAGHKRMVHDYMSKAQMPAEIISAPAPVVFTSAVSCVDAYVAAEETNTQQWRAIRKQAMDDGDYNTEAFAVKMIEQQTDEIADAYDLQARVKRAIANPAMASIGLNAVDAELDG